jgi:uncharacterized ferredoxin-like protein
MTDRDGAKEMKVMIPAVDEYGECSVDCPLYCHHSCREALNVWIKGDMFPGPECVQYQGGKDD